MNKDPVIPFVSPQEAAEKAKQFVEEGNAEEAGRWARVAASIFMEASTAWHLREHGWTR